ncbi:MAG: TauD/TfdA dioxygenase family protein [Myxococcota bacterium]
MATGDPLYEAFGEGATASRLGPVRGFGLSVEGFDLTLASSVDRFSEEAFEALRQRVVAEGLVVFRNQNLGPVDQVALGRRFGELESLVVEGDDADPSMIVIGNVDESGETFADDDPRMKLMSINEGWHTDSSFREIPASFSIFSAQTLPPEGGDTFFASLQAAWDALSPQEQTALYGRVGVHDYDAAYRLRGNSSGAAVGFNMPEVHHPLVRMHPETQRVGLYVSEHVSGVVGMEPEAALGLLDLLIEVTTREEAVVRHTWLRGDVAIWDNRSMLHKAQGFDARYPRVMHHVRVAGGDAPIAAIPVAVG